MAIKDELFDEVSALNALLKKIPDDKFCKNEAETKWMKIFNENDSFSLLYKLVSIVFSLPVSNAFVERVFSLVSAQWNYGVVSKNKQLMEKIVSEEKYGTK